MMLWAITVWVTWSSMWTFSCEKRSPLRAYAGPELPVGSVPIRLPMIWLSAVGPFGAWEISMP